MLKIEKLHISGFKSFADPTEIILGDGITAIVGPNGCGKSNVSDAISWVLGEQSAKNLRGSKMEDVIFNGTRDRKPMGMAEVLLTLVAVEDLEPKTEVDDIEVPETAIVSIEDAVAVAQGTMPDELGAAPEAAAAGDGAEPAAAGLVPEADKKVRPRPKRTVRYLGPKMFAGERITVGRRLYRSGESDYIMNGRSCRLRDIQDLFAGTGLGGYHYAIIEQGRIGQILSSKPQDRRALIEEAAGITKFKARKRAAELRLDSARQNLIRLNDIVSEVDRQINSLRRQAAKARRYRRLRDEMRDLLRDVFAADWERMESELDRLDRLSKKAKNDEIELAAKITEFDTGHRVAVVAAREAEEELARVRDRAAALELEADRARNRHQYQKEQLASLMLRREEIGRERDAIAERLSLIAAERTRKTEEHATLSAQTDAEAARLAQMESAYQHKLRELNEHERELDTLRHKLVAEVSRTERLRTAQHQIDDAERRLNQDGARLEREAQQAATRREEAEKHLARLVDENEMSSARLEELRAQIVERVESLAAAKARAERAARDLSGKQEQRSAFAHRLASLEELDTRHAYYSEAVQQVLGLEGNSFNALGTLADYAEVEPEFEPALESLFGRELQSILVPGLDEALSGVEYLVSTEAGRAAFLVVGSGGGEETAEKRTRTAQGVSVLEPLPRQALALLKLPSAIASAVERAYPEKAAAFVVGDIEEALERSRVAEAAGESRVFVTLSGEQVVNGRVVIGGSSSEKGAHLLGIKREIKELKTNLERVVWDVGSAEAELSESRKAVSALEAESGQLDNALRADEKTAIERTMRIRQLETDFERAEQHIRVVESERKRLAEELVELNSRRESLTAEFQTASAERRNVEDVLKQKQQGLADLRLQVEAEGRTLGEARAAAAARQERRRAVAAELRRMGDEETDLNARRDRSQVESVEVDSRIGQIQTALVETVGQTEQFSAERAGMDEALATALQALSEARATVDRLEEDSARARAELDAAKARVSELEVDRARLLSDAEHLRRDAVHELSQPIEEVVQAAREARAAGPKQDMDDIDLLEGEVYPDIPMDDLPPMEDPAEVARLRLEQIRRTLDALGAVNMMALEELEEAQVRFDFLTTQRKDIVDSIESTENALGEIKKRSRLKFREAFTEINQNFGDMFQELFGGGRGEMILLDEEDLLESGIDIIAQPPGKRLQNVLLLSGGEKAMTAIALVLAIFKYKPSPFCILDEVDAPLDEVNVGRFSDHVIEMSQTTQFMVITHSKRTMEAARALYGVTMEEPGVSKLVSVKFAEAHQTTSITSIE